MPTIPDFQAGRSAHLAHQSLQRSLALAERAQHCAVLWFADILQRGLFRELGYSSMQAYATEALGFSRAKAGDFLRLAGKLEELPQLKESVARGDVGYTKAREVIKVATPRTESQWVALATTATRRTLAAKVAHVRKKALTRHRHPEQPELLPVAAIGESLAREIPVRVTVEMTPEQFARYESLWERLHKLGGVPVGTDQVEALLAALDEHAEVLALGTSKRTTDSDQASCAAPAPRGATPNFQINVHQCPDCRQATVQTSAGEKPIGRAEIERIHCDAVIAEPGRRARSVIPPKTRREVLSRDRHRCQGGGCTNTRFLEVHHRRPISQGGGHDPGNLITLCGACHRWVHERPQSHDVAMQR
jgi:HNH endonuclease/Domain of unknown function (DUF222)